MFKKFTALIFMLLMPIGAAWAQSSNSNLEASPVFMKVDVAVGDNRDLFLKQLRSFVDENQFAMLLTYKSGPPSEHITIHIFRTDLEVVGTNDNGTGVFNFSVSNWIHRPCCTPDGTFRGWLSRKLGGTAVTEFLNGLKSSVSTIPGAHINVIYSTDQTTSGTREVDYPIRNVDISMKKDSSDLFLKRLRDFAETHRFAMQQCPPKHSCDQILIYRNDLEVSIDSYVNGDFDVAFYEGKEGSKKAIAASDEFLKGLKQVVSPIPGAQLTVNK